MCVCAKSAFCNGGAARKSRLCVADAVLLANAAIACYCRKACDNGSAAQSEVSEVSNLDFLIFFWRGRYFESMVFRLCCARCVFDAFGEVVLSWCLSSLTGDGGVSVLVFRWCALVAVVFVVGVLVVVFWCCFSGGVLVVFFGAVGVVVVLMVF